MTGLLEFAMVAFAVAIWALIGYWMVGIMRQPH
jgi:hypothetical protein